MTKNTTTPDVGRSLAAARLQRGIAQSTVARRAGLAPSYLSRIENGKVHPAFRTVMRIVRVLDLDPAEILGPRVTKEGQRGPCPVTVKGQCLLDLVRSTPDLDSYTPREIRLMRRFALWLKSVDSGRLRAMEILLDDLSSAADVEAEC